MPGTPHNHLCAMMLFVEPDVVDEDSGEIEEYTEE